MASGAVARAFAAVRPPGHHAECARAMGFCFYNNVAVAALAARQQEGVDRVLVLDWDVHHGGDVLLGVESRRVWVLQTCGNACPCYAPARYRLSMC